MRKEAEELIHGSITAAQHDDSGGESQPVLGKEGHEHQGH